jgi:hypothetical protein
MGAESKNPGKASFTMLRQGVLSMLSWENALMLHFHATYILGMFRLRAKDTRLPKYLSRAPLNMTALMENLRHFLIRDTKD